MLEIHFRKKDVRNRFWKQMLEIVRGIERIAGRTDTSKDGKTEEKKRRQAEMPQSNVCLFVEGKGCGQ